MQRIGPRNGGVGFRPNGVRKGRGAVDELVAQLHGSRCGGCGAKHLDSEILGVHEGHGGQEIRDAPRINGKRARLAQQALEALTEDGTARPLERDGDLAAGKIGRRHDAPALARRMAGHGDAVAAKSSCTGPLCAARGS